ncbi:MAG TPA: hypothetical protein ENF84_00515 [Chloroflexi bacterium]|nr:hypothetical protein [Chloroflexota bacterium]
MCYAYPRKSMQSGLATRPTEVMMNKEVAKSPLSSRRSKVVTTSDGEVLIDLKRYRVIVRGEIVRLTPMEFRLLSALVRRAGQVVPHKTLLAEVWGPEYVDKTHYLKLYIRYLRRKIEKDPSKPRYILTEWGVGYYFKP